MSIAFYGFALGLASSVVVFVIATVIRKTVHAADEL